MAAEKAKEYSSKGWSLLKSAYASAASAIEQTAAQVAAARAARTPVRRLCGSHGLLPCTAALLPVLTVPPAPPPDTASLQNGYNVDLGSRKVAASGSGGSGSYAKLGSHDAPHGYGSVSVHDEHEEWGNGGAAGGSGRQEHGACGACFGLGCMWGKCLLVAAFCRSVAVNEHFPRHARFPDLHPSLGLPSDTCTGPCLT